MVFLRRAPLMGALALSAQALLASTAHAQFRVEASGTDQNMPGASLPSSEYHAVADHATNASMIAVSDLAGGPTITLPDGRTVPAYWPGGPRPVTPGTFTWPGGVTDGTIQGPNAARYQTPFGTGYDGVARLLMYTGGSLVGGCTGALISDRVVLTAAHCVAGGVNRVDATFIGNGSSIATTTIRSTGISNIITMPGYTGSVVDQRDLALLVLDRPADAWIPRYAVAGGNPLFQTVEMVGFGSTGNGVTGAIFSNQFDADPTRRKALNRFELSRDASFLYVGSNPVVPILVADFDGADPGGTYPVARGGVTGWASRTVAQNNTSCNIFASFSLDPALRAQLCDEGFGIDEGIIGSGDSGGPAFVRVGGQLQIVGVTSFGNVACFPDQRLAPDGVTPSPRTDAGCPTGFVRYGSRFGMQTGHVWAGGLEQAGFIGVYAPGAVSAIIPEPSTWALLATGLGGLGLVARRRRPIA